MWREKPVVVAEQLRNATTRSPQEMVIDEFFPLLLLSLERSFLAPFDFRFFALDPLFFILDLYVICFQLSLFFSIVCGSPFLWIRAKPLLYTMSTRSIKMHPRFDYNAPGSRLISDLQGQSLCLKESGSMRSKKAFGKLSMITTRNSAYYSIAGSYAPHAKNRSSKICLLDLLVMKFH
jgi:hypothetical protein